MLVHLVASHDIFDVFNQISQDPRYAPYIPVNILRLYILLIHSYCKSLIVILVFTKDKRRLVSPFQYSTEPQRELKNMLRDVGFDVLHCSHRETTYLHVDSHAFLRKYTSKIKILRAKLIFYDRTHAKI